MERVVDLIDRQARLLTGEKRLPADDYVYAKNEGVNTDFIYDIVSNTYYFTLKAKDPAVINYYKYKKGTYTDGVVGVYLNNSGAIRYRIYLENTNIYAKFNTSDETITFYNVPLSTVFDMEDHGYVEYNFHNPVNYYTEHPVDYHRDHRAGEGPS
jgi:hypothetical protein